MYTVNHVYFVILFIDNKLTFSLTLVSRPINSRPSLVTVSDSLSKNIIIINSLVTSLIYFIAALNLID